MAVVKVLGGYLEVEGGGVSSPGVPTQPIYNPARPAHPIYNPPPGMWPNPPVDPGYGVGGGGGGGGPVDPGYGVSPGHPAHPIYNPAYPAHPIYNPAHPDNTLPGQPPGIWGGGNVPYPTPPIYIPPNVPPDLVPPEPPTPGAPTTPIPPPEGSGGWPTQGIAVPPYVVITYPGIGPVTVAPPATSE